DVGCDPADHGLPGMPVRIDEAGDDNAAGGVDHLRVARLEPAAHGRDALVLDQHVAAEDVAELGIHRQHMTIPKHDPLGHDPLPFPTSSSSQTELAGQSYHLLCLQSTAAAHQLTDTARRHYRPAE